MGMLSLFSSMTLSRINFNFHMRILDYFSTCGDCCIPHANRASGLGLPSLWGSCDPSSCCVGLRVSLKMLWVPTDRNLADAPSRALGRSNSMLSPALRHRLWSCFGPLAFDLMALPLSILRDPAGRPLPFFSRASVPSSAGFIVFAQRPPAGRLYTFPPFAVVTSLIRLFIEWGAVDVVVVLPVYPDRPPAWDGLLRSFVREVLSSSSPSASFEHQPTLLRYPAEEFPEFKRNKIGNGELSGKLSGRHLSEIIYARLFQRDYLSVII